MRGLALGIVVVACLAPSVASADKVTEYDVLLDHGVDLFEAGNYDAALEAFRAAHLREPKQAEAVFYIAKTHQRSGNFEDALRTYHEFLKLADADDPDRAEAEQLKKMLMRHLNTKQARIRAYVYDLEDPKPQEVDLETPPVRPLTVATLEHREDPRDRARDRFLVSAAISAVGLGAVVYAGLRVQDYENEKLVKWQRLVEEQPSIVVRYQNACDAAADAPGQRARDVVDACNSGKRWTTATNVFVLSSAVAVGTAAYYYYKGYVEDAPEQEPMRVSPALSRDSIGVGFELDF